MWNRDRANRARWARNQASAAREAFVASLPSAREENAAKLAGLREMLAMMEQIPSMTDSARRVRERIAYLEKLEAAL